VSRLLSKEERTEAIARLQDYFRREREEELGELAAGLLLDFIDSELGPLFHNHGVRAAKIQLSKVWEGLEESLDLLERRPDRRR
jgi:uncharacterized protein (DUF2164 family)